jgi:hypothetical protein
MYMHFALCIDVACECTSIRSDSMKFSCMLSVHIDYIRQRMYGGHKNSRLQSRFKSGVMEQNLSWLKKA